jgi:hypothetical protein
MYEGMLSEVRSLNGTLPLSKRVRVVLGDPPIDWSVVQGPADEDMNDWRDAHFAWVVEEHVVKKGRRASCGLAARTSVGKCGFPIA